MPDWMGWWVIVKAGLWIAYSKKQIASAQQIGFPCNKSSKKIDFLPIIYYSYLE